MVERNDRGARRNGRDEGGKRSDEGHPGRHSPGNAVEPDAANPARHICNDHVRPTAVRHQRRK